MPFERWGSLSVADHTDTASLAANVLLYDRVIVPVMTHQADRNERAYWVSHGWDPDLQLRRLDQLEELAIRRPWDASRRELFRTRFAELAAEQFDAEHIDAYGMTRAILAQEQVTEKLPGVQHVQVIPAYNSTVSLQQDFHLSNAHNYRSAQAFLLTRRLAVPDGNDPEQTLARSVELSREPSFRAKRSDLFDWQEFTSVKGCTPEAAVDRITEMVDAYNAEVKSASSKVRWKLAFAVCGIGLGFASGVVAVATASAALSLVQFAMFDSKPAIEAGSTRPAAMFHDITARVGISLAPQAGTA